MSPTRRNCLEWTYQAVCAAFKSDGPWYQVQVQYQTADVKHKVKTFVKT